jgi:hypothetical protein
MVAANSFLLPAMLTLAGVVPAQNAPASREDAPTLLHYTAQPDGPGAGKHIVFVTGDEEYRSEEGMPQLARILARLGCRTTVLFAIDRATGAIDPTVQDHIPGLEQLATADLLVLFTRFRNLPDDAMQHVVDYVDAGRPIVALRTSTHAFAPRAASRFASWAWNAPDGGFGRRVLGETWIAHHGEHGKQGSRGIVVPEQKDHPILRGIADGSVFDPADVYAVRLPLPNACAPLLLGEVTEGVTPAAPRAVAKAGRDDKPGLDPNAPMMPLAWTHAFAAENGKTARVFVTTLGSAEAFLHAGSRRLLVNACLWALGREAAIQPDLDVSLVGSYQPRPFGFDTHARSVRPIDLRWPLPKPNAK